MNAPAVLPARRATALGSERARACLRSPWSVALVAFALYGIYALVAILRHGAESFAFVSADRLFQSDASPTIDTYAHVSSKGNGYDGQFYLFQALDPIRAWHYLDAPTYRSTHLLYPLLAHAVTFERPAWTAASLVWINVAAIAAGTLFASLLAVRRGCSAWWGSLYFLFPGLFNAFMRDLAEPVAFALAAAGVWAATGPRSRGRLALAILLFGLAGVTREVTLLIPFCLGLWQMFEGFPRCRRALSGLLLLLLPIVPYVVLRAVVLHRLGSAVSERVGHGMTTYPATFYPFARLPYGGMVDADRHDILVLTGVAFAGTVLLLSCLVVLHRNWRDGVFVALCLSLVAQVVFLNRANYSEYPGAGRLQTGAVLLAIACVPAFRASRVSRGLAVVAVAAAYLPMVVFVAYSLARGFKPL